MKRSILAVLVAACLILATAGFAAEQGGMSDQSAVPSDTTRGAAQADNIIKADDLAGKTVQDRAGTTIGDIKSIALDTTTGTAYALISMEGKLHPVPLSALKKSQDKYVLNVDKSRFAQSPSFTEDTMKQEMAKRNFDTQVYQFYGVAPPWGSSKHMMK